MHTTVQHRRAANTLASTPFARPEPLPSHRRPARHNPARPPHPSSASSRCELRGARTAGGSLDLLGQDASAAASAAQNGDKVSLLNSRARATFPRIRLTEGSIIEVRAYLFDISGVGIVDSTAFKLVKLVGGLGE